MRRNNAEWRDPTGNNAAFDADRPNPSTSTHRQIDTQPLNKFKNDPEYRGRRRLLRALQDELNSTSRTDTATRKKLGKEIAKLSQLQYTARVKPEEIGRSKTRRGRHRLQIS